MENAVDALKIAFAVFVFAIAVALTFSIVGQARATSDTILTLNDKTNLYEYVDSSDNNADEKDRIVGFETILPTIYRYAKEQYAVTILNNDGTPIVRFDTYTEGFMNEWNNTLKKMKNLNTIQQVETTFNAVKDRISIVDELIEKENSQWKNKIWNALVNESTYTPGTLYEVTNTNNTSMNVGAPWIGNDSEIIKRIEYDLLGTEYEKNGITYKGKGLNQYRDNKFKEKFIEIQTSGTTITATNDTDESIEYSLETVKGNKKLEIIYILQE